MPFTEVTSRKRRPSRTPPDIKVGTKKTKSHIPQPRKTIDQYLSNKFSALQTHSAENSHPLSPILPAGKEGGEKEKVMADGSVTNTVVTQVSSGQEVHPPTLMIRGQGEESVETGGGATGGMGGEEDSSPHAVLYRMSGQMKQLMEVIEKTEPNDQRHRIYSLL